MFASFSTEHLTETRTEKDRHAQRKRSGEEIMGWQCLEFLGNMNWKEGLLEQKVLNT